MLQTGKTA